MRRAGNKPLWAHKTNWSRKINRYLLHRKFEWSRFDIAVCYMIMGGIPTYLSLLNPLRSLSDNIDNLFFRKRSELWDEFRQLYRTHYSNSDQYICIVEALSTIFTYGIKPNTCSSLISGEVILDDLFAN